MQGLLYSIAEVERQLFVNWRKQDKNKIPENL